MLAGITGRMAGGSRWVALLAIAFSAILLGRVEPVYQHVVCWMVIAALALTLRWPAGALANQRWIVPIFLAWFTWLAFLVLQFTVVPTGMVSRLAPFTNLIRSKFVDKETTIFNTLSLVPSAGQAEWPSLAIGLGFLVLGATAFSKRTERLRLWWFITAVGIALSLLAISQYILNLGPIDSSIDADGATRWKFDIIDGNSLAAMLLLSLACLIGCQFEWMREAVREQIKRVARLNQIPVRSGRPTVREGLQELERRTVWREPIAFLFVGLFAYLAIAIAWIGSFLFIAGTLATILVWSISVRRLVPGRGRLLASILFGLLLVFVSTHLFVSVIGQSHDDTGGPIDRLTLSEQTFHWSDAIDAAFDSPRVGTGLGSYPYVHSLHLDFDSPYWIRDPHSMLLKWSVETGVTGIAILFVGMMLSVMLIGRLYRRRLTSTIFVGSYSVALIAGLAMLVLSILDSVVMTPVVLWSYALVLGSAATTARERPMNKIRSMSPASDEQPLQVNDAESQASSSWWIRLFGHPHLWTSLACASLFYSLPLLQRDIDDQALLAAVPLPTSESAPSDLEIDAVRDRLSKPIASGTRNAKLFELWGLWELADYRRDVVERLAQQGIELRWGETAPRSFFHTFQSLTDDGKQSMIDLWRGDSRSQQKLTRAMNLFESSLACNPLQPQIHLLDALYSPLTKRNERRAIINAKRLASGNVDVRFEIGKIGWSIDDMPLMTEQWKRVIAIPSNHTVSILTMASIKIGPEKVVDQIIADAPPNRWDEIRRLCQENDSLASFRSLVRPQDPVTDGD